LRETMSRLYHSTKVLSTLIFIRIRKRCSIILTTIASRSYSPVDRVVRVFRPLFIFYGTLYFIPKRLSLSSLTKGLQRVKCSPESPWHLKIYLFFYNLAVEHLTKVLLSFLITLGLSLFSITKAVPFTSAQAPPTLPSPLGKDNIRS